MISRQKLAREGEPRKRTRRLASLMEIAETRSAETGPIANHQMRTQTGGNESIKYIKFTKYN
ncbi:hypothetical protein LMG29739_05940 [Paraburkholderia solisilvae]|uniref:Uncharacterized protein n=1 Tax=Paraburkholderia solisilvae TaxID=624376 RepID=A0A6J5F0A0_9BURK|nr:hypothetical protein LMG29739_05940 [Paraburkholderia solisilvae]